MAETLDPTDLQILKTLQRNSKLTTKELADAVHLTPTPVFERQKRLERQGYIKKYVAVLDPEKLGQGLLVFCKVKLKQINHEIADDFTRRILRIPESPRTRYEAIPGFRAHQTGRHRFGGLHREYLRDERNQTKLRHQPVGSSSKEHACLLESYAILEEKALTTREKTIFPSFL